MDNESIKHVGIMISLDEKQRHFITTVTYTILGDVENLKISVQ